MKYWYLGTNDVRYISTPDWARLGITSLPAKWDVTNAWGVDETLFSAGAKTWLDSTTEFIKAAADPIVAQRPNSPLAVDPDRIYGLSKRVADQLYPTYDVVNAYITNLLSQAPFASQLSVLVAASLASDATLQATVSTLISAKVAALNLSQVVTGTSAANGGIVDSNNRRTWVEWADDGSPTARAATAVATAAGSPIGVSSPITEVSGGITDTNGRRTWLEWAADGSVPARTVSRLRSLLAIPDGRAHSRHIGADSPPVFTRVNNNVFVDRIDTTSSLPTMFWPCTHYVVGKIASPLDNYYRTSSTDHSNGAGGVRLATSPYPEGPWTDRGQVFADPTDNGQTETFQSVWLPPAELGTANGMFVAFYENQAVNGQPQWMGRTTSTDLVNWTAPTRVQSVSTAASVRYPSNMNQGYPSILRIGGKLVMYHSYGNGGTRPGTVLCYSDDWGVTWHKDPAVIRGFGAYTLDNTLEYSVNQFRPFIWRNRPWAVTVLGASGESGGADSPTDSIAVVPMSPDFKHVIGRHTVIWTPTTTWEINASGLSSIYLWTDPVTGNMYLDYVTGKNRMGTLVAKP